VQLTDDRYATGRRGQLVAAAQAERARHDPAVPREDALVLDLESAVGLGIRRSIKPQQLPPTALDYLAPEPARRLLLRAGGGARDRLRRRP
jgi:hypothetical protein